MIGQLYRWVMPYCIQRLDSGRYIILNREYKPVGTWTEGWVNYDRYPHTFKLGITPKRAARMSWNNSTNTDRVYFYHDGTKPWDSKSLRDAYFDRLSILLSIMVKEDAPRLNYWDCLWTKQSFAEHTDV